jgi:hypothetical protein
MAVFENKTIAEIRDLLINSFQEKFNKTFRPLKKSFIKAISTVFAGVFVILDKQIGWLFLQLFPDTSYWSVVNILGMNIRPLVKWGILIGVGEPHPGSQWAGKIAVSPTRPGSPLPAGTLLKSDLSGKLYITDEGLTLGSESETIPITCTENGTAGNLEVGDILNFVSPLGFVKKEAVVSGVLLNASDAETESEYRFRVVNRWKMQPRGGALADYRIWASEVAGVLNVYPYTDPENGGGVLLFVSGNPSVYADRVPGAALLIKVGEACTYDPNRGGGAYRKPLGAVIDPRGDQTYSNIRPVLITFFDIYISGLQGISPQDFSAAVKSPLRDYLQGREPYIRGLSDDNNKTNIVSKNNISSVVDQISISVKAEFDSVVMRKNEDAVSNYVLGMGELSDLRNFYIDGVLY